MLLSVLFAAGTAESAPLRLAALDVGEGQSILIMDQGHGILIDTGHAARLSHVLSRLDSYNVNSLDYLILTHLHPDHAGGYPRLRSKFPHLPVLYNCHPVNPEQFIGQDKVLQLSDDLEHDPAARCVQRGDNLSWRGHRIEFLWPENPEGTDLNHHSLVLKISTDAGREVLIMGDADKRVEKELFGDGQRKGWTQRIDVLVAGHHGAMDTGDEEFIRSIQPRFTIVSVSENSRSDYPAEKTLHTLRRHSDFVFRTDHDGEICLTLSHDPKWCDQQLSVAPAAPPQ